MSNLLWSNRHRRNYTLFAVTLILNITGAFTGAIWLLLASNVVFGVVLFFGGAARIEDVK